MNKLFLLCHFSNMSSQKCQFENCDIEASFNLPGEAKRIYCKSHAETNMVDVKTKKCQFGTCSKQPSFNQQGEVIPIYCKSHADEDMVNVKSKKCQFDTCDKNPTFNHEGETKGIYCKTHAEKDMVNVNSKKCQFENCSTRPSFNNPGEKLAIYCKKHAEIDMVNINLKECQFEFCDTVPSFNYPTETTGIYCKTHAEENMVNVISRKCHFENCKIQPNYNYEGELKSIYCKTHAENGMVNVNHTKCQHENCNTRAANPTYKGYCTRCFLYIFPDETITRNYKLKEKHVTDWIQSQFGQHNPIFDKIVNYGCSKRRPDSYIDLLTHVVITECDENQHQNYSCENKRMMELFQDFGYRHIVFIRFNPDKYIDHDGNTVKSCFKVNKTSGVLIIDVKSAWEQRLNKLKETIQENIDIIPEKTITVINLFYDGTVPNVASKKRKREIDVV